MLMTSLRALYVEINILLSSLLYSNYTYKCNCICCCDSEAHSHLCTQRSRVTSPTRQDFKFFPWDRGRMLRQNLNRQFMLQNISGKNSKYQRTCWTRVNLNSAHRLGKLNLVASMVIFNKSMLMKAIPHIHHSYITPQYNTQAHP